MSARHPQVRSMSNPIEEERPDLPRYLKDSAAFEADERDSSRSASTQLYFKIKQMTEAPASAASDTTTTTTTSSTTSTTQTDRISQLLRHPLDPELSRPLGGGSLTDYWTDHEIDSDIFGPTTLTVLSSLDPSSSSSAPNADPAAASATTPSLAHLKQVFESLKRRLIWTLEHESELSNTHQALQKQKYSAWLETEKLMDRLIERELGDDEEGGQLKLWPSAAGQKRKNGEMEVAAERETDLGVKKEEDTETTETEAVNGTPAKVMKLEEGVEASA